MVADKVDDGFVGDSFKVVVFKTLVVVVFGLVNVVVTERAAAVADAGLARAAIVDDVVEVVFVALTRDVVLVAGLLTVLQFEFN